MVTPESPLSYADVLRDLNGAGTIVHDPCALPLAADDPDWPLPVCIETALDLLERLSPSALNVCFWALCETIERELTPRFDGLAEVLAAAESAGVLRYNYVGPRRIWVDADRFDGWDGAAYPLARAAVSSAAHVRLIHFSWACLAVVFRFPAVAHTFWARCRALLAIKDVTIAEVTRIVAQESR